MNNKATVVTETPYRDHAFLKHVMYFFFRQSEADGYHVNRYTVLFQITGILQPFLCPTFCPAFLHTFC